ncbi:carbohydrate porin [Candidatus Omnitrophota bacterium]
MKKIRAFLTLAIFINLISTPAYSNTPAKEVTPEKKKGYLEYIPAEGIEVESLDLTIKPTATGVLQGTPNPNKRKGGKLGTSWVTYFDFEKKFSDWGEIFFRLQQGDGLTVSRDLSLFSGVNYNAHENHGIPEPRIYRYKQFLFDKQLTLVLGKLEHRNYIDQSKYAGDDDIQFLSDLFNRSAVIEWPEHYGLGLNVNMSPKVIDFLEVEFNYFDATGAWKNVIQNAMYTGEIKVKTAPLFNLDPTEWDGNYRVYGFANMRRHPEISDEIDDKNVNCGFGFGFDQSITSVFGIFGRFGWQRPDLIPANGGTTIDLSWSAGGQMTGKYWRRENDVLGVAVGQLFPSKEYEDAGNPGSAEGHVETYYSFMVNKHLLIGPNFELVWNPNGVSKASQGDNDVIFVYGARARVIF